MKTRVMPPCILALLAAGAGCAKKMALELPFDAAQARRTEMFRSTVPEGAHKKTLTKPAEIDAVYAVFGGLAVLEGPAQAKAGGQVTSFRFCLEDGTQYALVYEELAVKSGNLHIPAAQKSHATSADIAAC